ncbi:RagB/SusD family nutrient uptake outer membrane protein [Marinoscillum sp.]|uniref:RagB/SusD family nutrient uptake outer membrane protein n=1 Tax=Marinoscillum sp. TaxID=2024838 RepID=UPI003BA90858
MKKYNYIYLIGLLLIGFGCKEEVIELSPEDSISEEAAFETPERIESTMVGVYDAAQSGFYRGSEVNNRGYIFGAAHIQQADMRGEDMLLINTFYDFTYRATYTTVTENNRYFWENGYRLVNLANLFIDGVTNALESGVIDEATANAYLGEARFLRGLAFHEMVIHFSRPYLDGNGAEMGIPIPTFGANSASALEAAKELGRGTVADTYAQILEDMDFAELNLPATRSGSSQVVRATSGAAIAMKTRVYLHMGQWDDVITEANKIVPASAPFTGGGYSLTATPDGPWANNTSVESIFSMNMSANDNLNVNAALANMYGSSSNGARGEVAISPIIWNQSFWHPDDLRRSQLVTGGANGRLFTTKYRDYVNNSDFSPILRYAEVLLNLAEAEARTGNTTRGSALLNAVRDRAIAGTMNSYGNIANANDLVNRILQERRIEYLAEGMRWKDIHRNAVDPTFSTGGIPAKMVSASVDGSTYSIGDTDLTKVIPAIPYSDFRFLWPLPASEVTINELLAAQQNPGY